MSPNSRPTAWRCESSTQPDGGAVGRTVPAFNGTSGGTKGGSTLSVPASGYMRESRVRPDPAWTRSSREPKPGFPICLPQMAPLYTRRPPSARNSCSSQHRPASEAVSSARGDVRSTGGPVFPSFLRHRSTRGPFLRQSDCVACAARQSAGTGSAQIRRNMSPNSRRVRCPSASRSQ